MARRTLYGDDVGCIYLLTSPKGKHYVGLSSKTAEIRFERHVMHLEAGRRNAIHRALKKYGPDKFTIETLYLSDDLQKLRRMEQLLIASLNTLAPNGYNLTGGGEGSAFWSAETRAKSVKSIKKSWENPSPRRRAASALAVKAMRDALANPKLEQIRRQKISSTMKKRNIGRGASNGFAKLNEQAVRDIRKARASGERVCDLMQQYGISRKLVQFIVTRKRWGHVT